MSDCKNKPEPKKIKMPPLVDRSNEYDTIAYYDGTRHQSFNENHNQNDQKSIQQLETESSN